jgi:hypothetical protein
MIDVAANGVLPSRIMRFRLLMSERRWVALIMAVLVLSGCSKAQKPPIDTGVCSLAESPPAFDGKVVRVRAHIESDGMHSASVADPECPDSLVAITWANAEQNSRIRDLIDTLFSKAQHPGTLDKEIRASVTGTFHWSASDRPVQRIELLDVRDVVVKPRADSPFAAATR